MTGRCRSGNKVSSNGDRPNDQPPILRHDHPSGPARGARCGRFVFSNLVSVMAASNASQPIILPTVFRKPGLPWTKKTLVERFEAKFIPEPNSGCWLWIGCVNNRGGYGRFLVGDRWTLAHRFSYQTYNGPLLEGLVLDHLCRMRCCVNPDHLEQVTNAVNIQRGGSNIRPACKNGHPWTEETTWRSPRSGWRQCRQCKRDFRNLHFLRNAA